MFLEVRHLRLIEAITKQGSVTKAGSVLHLSQSALSHQLKELEDGLGVALFHRVRKRMLPTRAGERLLAGSRPILSELGTLEEEVRDLDDDRAGLIRISTECSTAYHWLPNRLCAFSRRFPRVEVRMVLEATGHPIQALLKGQLDLAIVNATPRKQKIEYRPLFQDDLLVVTRADHRLAMQPYVTADGFTDETLIVYNSLYDTHMYRTLLKPAGILPRHVLHVQLTEGIVGFIRAGLGIAVLARWVVEPYLEAGDLVGLPLTDRPLTLPWNAATIAGQADIPHMSEFIRLLSKPPESARVAPEGELLAQEA